MDIRILLDKKTTAYDAYDTLSGYGYSDVPKALTNLKFIAGGVEDPLLIELIPGLIKACSASPDPDNCLNNFERVSAASKTRESFLSMLHDTPDAVKTLAPLLSSSNFLATFIAGQPEETLARLLGPGRLDRPKEREELIKEAAEQCPPDTKPDDAMARLRRFKYTEFLRITVRDLLGRAGLAETTMELSNLADAALEAALGVASHELDRRFGPPRYDTPGGLAGRCPFTVIAMGKLGGQELNFSSDIDIMYLYLTDEGMTSGPGRITNHQYFVKMGELVTKLIGEKTSDGFVFRVDTRLRPEGERGDLAQSLRGYEIYYESWGQTWERSALTKARPCAGDMDLGRAFMETIRPFVFRKYLDYTAIGEIRDMKQRVEKSATARAAGEIDLKKGSGGIREIEFFISALQLIYGGREPGVRERNTLKALHRLALKDLISFEEQRDLSKAYEFLRTAEHRLQVVDERQIHSMPNEYGEIRALALRMGYRDSHADTAGEVFMKDLGRRARRVRAIYDGLFADQAMEAAEGAADFDLLLPADATEEDATRILAAKGFLHPHQAYRNVVLLRDGSAGSSLTPRSRRLFMGIMPALLAGCAASPDPDMALNNLESFVTSFGSREALSELIQEKSEAPALITKMFGSSEYFSRLLISHPEMSDLLLLSGEEAMDKTGAEMSLELAETLSKPGSFAEKMDLLRRYKHAEELRIGIKDIFMDPGYRAISADLTALAEAVLGAAVGMSLEDLELRYGTPKGLEKGRGIAVVGLGKLGARALNYGSDLDIFFIYEKAGPAAKAKPIGCPEFFARLSERVIFALSSLTKEGFAFRVDTRLRPGGSKGVLAHTLGSLEKYYARSASLWEFQALTRARAVAGDKALSRGFEDLRKVILTKPREAGSTAGEIKAMRARMERELGRHGKGFHIKYGRGGLVDVEFIVQYLQLLHGAGRPDLLVADTYQALELLVEQGIIPGDDGDTLKGSYAFLRELESKLRMTTGQPGSLLPEDEERLAMLAARMGYGSRGAEAAGALQKDCREHASKVRGIFDRIF